MLCATLKNIQRVSFDQSQKDIKQPECIFFTFFDVNILMYVVYVSQSHSKQKAKNGLHIALFCVNKCVSFQSRRTRTPYYELYNDYYVFLLFLFFIQVIHSYKLTIN